MARLTQPNQLKASFSERVTKMKKRSRGGRKKDKKRTKIFSTSDPTNSFHLPVTRLCSVIVKQTLLSCVWETTFSSWLGLRLKILGSITRLSERIKTGRANAWDVSFVMFLRWQYDSNSTRARFSSRTNQLFCRVWRRQCQIYPGLSFWRYLPKWQEP